MFCWRYILGDAGGVFLGGSQRREAVVSLPLTDIVSGPVNMEGRWGPLSSTVNVSGKVNLSWGEQGGVAPAEAPHVACDLLKGDVGSVGAFPVLESPSGDLCGSADSKFESSFRSPADMMATRVGREQVVSLFAADSMLTCAGPDGAFVREQVGSLSAATMHAKQSVASMHKPLISPLVLDKGVRDCLDRVVLTLGKEGCPCDPISFGSWALCLTIPGRTTSVGELGFEPVDSSGSSGAPELEQAEVPVCWAGIASASNWS